MTLAIDPDITYIQPYLDHGRSWCSNTPPQGCRFESCPKQNWQMLASTKSSSVYNLCVGNHGILNLLFLISNHIL